MDLGFRNQVLGCGHGESNGKENKTRTGNQRLN